MPKYAVFRHAATGERYAVTLEPGEYLWTESNCPGHAASDDPKICIFCGTHIDSYRQDIWEDDDKEYP